VEVGHLARHDARVDARLPHARDDVLALRVDRKLRVEAHAVGEFFLLEDDLERVALGPVKRFQLEDDVPYIATNRR
jgi:hypothetical protein